MKTRADLERQRRTAADGAAQPPAELVQHRRATLPRSSGHSSSNGCQPRRPWPRSKTIQPTLTASANSQRAGAGRRLNWSTRR
jgi:hypothetical protein